MPSSQHTATPGNIPVRLRPAVGDAIGTTAFFRNRALFDTLLDELLEAGRPHYSILFHACSIGAEVYTLIVQYLERGLQDSFTLSCSATDKQPSFVDFARQAMYPEQILQGCTESEKAFFTQQQQSVSPVAEVTDRVSFLPASDFADFDSTDSFDIVSLLNALVYVPAATQARVLDRIGSYNSGWLITSGFHQQSIRQDLQRNGYSPVLKRVETIHNGWTDRLTPAPIAQESLPPNIFTDWSLRPFSKIEDYEYRYCALFRKGASAPADATAGN